MLQGSTDIVRRFGCDQHSVESDGQDHRVAEYYYSNNYYDQRAVFLSPGDWNMSTRLYSRHLRCWKVLRTVQSCRSDGCGCPSMSRSIPSTASYHRDPGRGIVSEDFRRKQFSRNWHRKLLDDGHVQLSDGALVLVRRKYEDSNEPGLLGLAYSTRSTGGYE